MMAGRRLLRLERLEARQLLTGDIAPLFRGADFIASEFANLEEGISGGPRFEAVAESADHHPRLAPESDGGRIAGPTLPVRLNSTNLHLTSATIADGLGNPQAYLLIGQQIVLRAEWTSSNVAGTSFTVGFYFNGIRVDSSTINGAAGTVPYWWYRYGSFASPGVHTLTITVDPDNVVAEDNEADNSITIQVTAISPPDLPMKFQTPIGRSANQTWAINNYADVDPRSNFASDYRNGPFQYNGHNAIDAGPWGFYMQDQGIPILAAADGIVDAVQDGFFDRETSLGNRPGNFVQINHGNGFKTLYYHFAANTITVQVGSPVRAGQLLGQMGSSGSSTGTHLHYTPYYREAPIETGFAPNDYNHAPMPYGGDVPPFFFATGITNRMVDSDVGEQIANNYSYAQGSVGTLAFWLQAYNLKVGDLLQWRYYRPNGTILATNSFTLPTNYRFSWWYWSRNLTNFSSTPGTWRVEFSINNSVSQAKEFTINATGSAAIRMTSSGDGLINSGRTTPINYGTHSAGFPSRTYQIENHGTAALALTDLKLPPGFSLLGGFPASIPAGGFGNFSVRLDTQLPGDKLGAISFKTNDPEAPVFWFNVSGKVLGSEPEDWFHLTMAGPARAYYPGDLPIRIAPLGDIIPTSTAVEFGQGTLRVEIDNIAYDGEVLSVGGNGIGPSDPIAAVSGGRNGRPLIVQFRPLATLDSVIRTMRGIRYSSQSSLENYTRRYIRFTITDGSGTIINSAIAHVIPGGKFDYPKKSDADSPNSTATVNSELAVKEASIVNPQEKPRLVPEEIRALAWSQIFQEWDALRNARSRGTRPTRVDLQNESLG